MRKTILFLVVTLLTLNLKAQVKIILDCDFGDDGDDLVALCMLHHLQDNNECEIIAIGQCNNTKGALAAIDIINTFYGRPNIPMGQQHSDVHKGDQYITFLRENYPELTDLSADYSPDVVKVYRKALAEAPDNSVKFIVEGLKKNMSDLLKSLPDNISPLSGIELVKQKVIEVYDMGGKYPSGKEFNFYLEGPSTKYYVENYPVPIFFAGDCWGGLHTGVELRKMDTPPGRALDHKLAGTGGLYWDDKPVEKWQNSFDCAPVFAAIKGIDNYFNTISGCNKISEDGSNQFIKSVKCNQVYAPCDNLKVSFKTMSNEIEKMVTAKPKYGSKK